ncbi:hypothetical protein K461DRAFT_220375 [Myriangium duriaei CBS 260.36]|uniref:J domain-containing protein n=1 Tax=Myriangium duriaei CBS 260.36 TaxID=1168546 RepID=A0A9P4JBX5_9PEZI|nr:hypothetical protein K461DRAFT_220375 [Myriangium duriaei CBS 260.36]
MSDLLSLAGWYFLPNLVTGWTQSAFYAIWIRAGEPKPQPGSRQFVNDRRRIYVLVVLAYLFYTIYEADWQVRLAGDFYQDLGAPLSADERVLNSKFRRLTVKYHPDKIAASVDRQIAEAFYIRLKLGKDVLVDPARRFAYDRFGPDILQWRSCKTIYDYVFVGVKNALMYYGVTAVTLATLSVVGYMRAASFWRFTAIAGMFVLELYTITRPEAPSFLTNFVNPFLTTFTAHPPYLQYQMLSVFRKVLLSFFVALSQVAPVFFPPAPADKEATPEQLSRLEGLTQQSEQEVMRLTALEMTPFAGNADTLRDLRVHMRHWLVDNTMRANPQVRDAMGRVLQPRGGAPVQGS